jgi:hypothetical protein
MTLVTLLGGVWTHAAQPRVSYSDRYGILEDRNVFLKDRTQKPVAPTPTTQPTRRTPEESFVLTGIALEDEGRRAHFENPDTLVVTRVAPGDSLANGRIGEIDIDAVAYDRGDTRTWIEFGADLTGKQSILMAMRISSPSSISTTQPVVADVAGLNPNDPNLTPEQKMKLRRAQELNRK